MPQLGAFLCRETLPKQCIDAGAHLGARLLLSLPILLWKLGFQFHTHDFCFFFAQQLFY